MTSCSYEHRIMAHCVSQNVNLLQMFHLQKKSLFSCFLTNLLLIIKYLLMSGFKTSENVRKHMADLRSIETFVKLFLFKCCMADKEVYCPDLSQNLSFWFTLVKSNLVTQVHDLFSSEYVYAK